MAISVVLLVAAAFLVFLGRSADSRYESAFAYAAATFFGGVAIFGLVLTVANDILCAIAMK